MLGVGGRNGQQRVQSNGERLQVTPSLLGSPEINEGNDSRSIAEVSNQNAGMRNRLVPVDNVLNLVQLNMLTVELDLTILTTAADNISVNTICNDTACPVEALS